jgi:hypothetical protein
MAVLQAIWTSFSPPSLQQEIIIENKYALIASSYDSHNPPDNSRISRQISLIPRF